MLWPCQSLNTFISISYHLCMFFFLCISSTGEIWGVVQDLWWTNHFPDVQKLPESPDQLQHPRGRCPRSHRAARVRVQWKEAQTLLCPSECQGRGLVKSSQGETLVKTITYLHVHLKCCEKVHRRRNLTKSWKYWPGLNIPHIQIWFSMHLKNYIVNQNWLSPISRERTCDVQHQGVGGGSFESCGLQGGASGLAEWIVIRGMFGCHFMVQETWRWMPDPKVFH